MSLTSIGSQFGKGGSGLTDGTLAGAIKELQGLTVSVIAGTTANTKINVAALRTEDTLLAALVTDDAGGAVALTNDVANMTIQATHATGTITFTGAPTNAQTLVVNGVTYTAKTTPTAATDFRIGGNVTATALALANTITAYENRRLSNGAQNVAAVTASPAAGVVTITSVIDGAGNGPVVTETGSEITVTNSGTATVTAACASVVEDTAIIVNGVTFTAKNAPVGDVQFDVKGTDAAQATEIARVINAYENTYMTLDVVASAANADVTIVPRLPKAGNIITLTEGCANTAVSGSGTLTNGTDTGGIKTTTDTSGKHIALFWFNKQ